VRAGTAARIAYYGHDLHFQRLLAQASRDGSACHRRAAEMMREVETRAWLGSDVVLYPSDEETEMVRALAPSVVARAVVPYGFADPAFTDRAPSDAANDDARRDDPTSDDMPWIVFVAGFQHPPNAEAATWFAREVMPVIMSRVPEARLAIIGSHPPTSVSTLCGPHVGLFADVSDAELRGWYRRAKVAVVPLLAGAGVKLKTVEALWHGVPAVLTPAGAQGLPGIEQLVPIEAQASGFADAVCELLTDDGLWRRQSAAQMAYARERFSQAAQSQSLLRALDLVVPAPRQPAVTADPVEGCVESVAMA
jgi:glycosyltransferase involved in cell wall biosynthesis